MSQDSPTSPPPGGEPRPVDVLIVGGGPAGLSTALHLLQEDASWAGRMLVLEKQRHPRHKLCGGGVTCFGLRILQGLGLRLPLPIPQARVEDLRLCYKGWTVHVRGYPLFVVYPRAEFDHYLAQAARERGVELRQDERVLSIHADGGGVLVQTDRARYLAQTVVGADGSSGITRRVVEREVAGQKPPISRVARTLEVLQPAPAEAPSFQGCYAVFDFSPVKFDLQGYFWDFPARGADGPFYNRGVYDARFYPGRPRAALPTLLAQALTRLDPESDSRRPDSHPIHCFSLGNRFSAPRLLLAGDAAGADPLLGEGIAPALGYGQVAAQAIQAAFERSDFSYKDYRQRVLAAPLGRYLLTRTYIAWWGYRLCKLPGYMYLLWAGLALASRVLPKPRVEA